MILRRLSNSIRRQDWFTVLVEIVIVVIGVFLGIQVANWNESQADKRLSKVYTKQLTIDVSRDIASTKSSISYYSAVLDSAFETNRLLESENPDARALVLAAYRATEIMIIPPERATWDQIVSSGHLELLPANLLGVGLASYYNFVEIDTTYDMLESSHYREVVRKIIPMSVQKAIREGCSDLIGEDNYVIGFIASCELEVDAATWSNVSDALRSDPEVRKELNYQYSHLAYAYFNYENNLKSIERILATLDPGADE